VRCTAFVSYCIRISYEFQKQFPSWNFLVPREELFGSSGGTFQSLRRNFSIPPGEFLDSSGGKKNFFGLII
jgi:hypothetical protein